MSSGGVTISFSPDSIREIFAGLVVLEAEKKKSYSSPDYSYLVPIILQFWSLVTDKSSSTQSRCPVTGKSCSSESTCPVTGKSCSTGSTCPVTGKSCSTESSCPVTGKACSTEASCPEGSGTCQVTGESFTEVSDEESDVDGETCPVKCSKTSEVETKVDTKRKPVYQEGDAPVFDLKGSMGPGSEGLADMMKMFAPMMENIMGGMGGGGGGMEQLFKMIGKAQEDGKSKGVDEEIKVQKPEAE